MATIVFSLAWTSMVKAQDQPAPAGPSQGSTPGPAKPAGKSQSDGQAQPAPPVNRIPDDTPGVTPPGAAKSVEIARYYYLKKDYRAALSRYMEAVNTGPDYAPGYLGMAKCEEKLGMKKHALESYRKYLDELPSDNDAQNAKDAQKAIRRLDSQIGQPAAD